MYRFITLSALALLCSAPFSAHAGDAAKVLAATPIRAADCHADAGLTPIERRVVEKAEQGALPLVQFIHRTRMVYQLDAMETVAWLDQRREAQRGCGAGVAHLAANGE